MSQTQEFFVFSIDSATLYSDANIMRVTQNEYSRFAWITRCRSRPVKVENPNGSSWLRKELRRQVPHGWNSLFSCPAASATRWSKVHGIRRVRTKSRHQLFLTEGACKVKFKNFNLWLVPVIFVVHRQRSHPSIRSCQTKLVWQNQQKLPQAKVVVSWVALHNPWDVQMASK